MLQRILCNAFTILAFTAVLGLAALGSLGVERNRAEAGLTAGVMTAPAVRAVGDTGSGIDPNGLR